ncbi:MAG: T9SS type A sorting domain-containing protein [Chitinophagales bacterium]|nr:T9SS type A sorting domain-containing protein [Chitinophagales bacterium]MDW8428099.1 T9SS type A sorting domain-containing protein [Chitinophagales bacterium]
MRHLLPMLLLGYAWGALAKQGGPDVWGYRWYDSEDTSIHAPVYKWIDITEKPNAVQVKLLADDNTRGPFAMNFDFHFYWYDVNTFWVGSNGYIIFEDAQYAAPFSAQVSQNLPNNFIGAFLNDLTFLGPNNPAECWYWISPTFDTLIVSWIKVPYFNTGFPGYTDSTNTFQLILSRVDNSITFQYRNTFPTSPYSGISFAGIENISGSVGLFWSNNPPSYPNQTPPDNYAIRFVYPAYDTVKVTDAGTHYADNPRTRGIFLIHNSSPYPLKAEIKNFGTQKLNPVAVVMNVKDPANGTPISTTVYTDTLYGSETEMVYSPFELVPSLVGRYKFNVITNYPGDIANKNNNKILEIIVIDTTQQEIELSYVPGINFAGSSINWVGDAGGIGLHFIPPFYPIAIKKLHFFITSNFFNSDFSAKIYDDDGINGLPFTLLDSVYVDNSTIVVNGWTTVTLNAPVIINSGGFYVSWNMEGEGIALGMATTPADVISRRSYEVFEYGWGIYRFGEDHDPMIKLTVEKYSYPVGSEAAPTEQLSMQIIPNPASIQTEVLIHMPANQRNCRLTIFSPQGQVVMQEHVGHGAGPRSKKLDVSSLPAGIYLAVLQTEAERIVKKFAITNGS